MSNQEAVVAVVQQSKTAGEQELITQITDIGLRAESITIETENDFNEAAEIGRLLQQKSAEVASFFKPMKDAAHKAHKEICEREKKVLAPINTAKNLLKDAMSEYTQKREAERIEAERIAREAAQAEANRMLAQAIELEEKGMTDEAATAIEIADMTDSIASSLVIENTVPKAHGVAQKTDYEIIDIDEDLVPVKMNGIELRHVDKVAVMKLIRESKGKIDIPGIKYTSVVKTSFRR